MSRFLLAMFACVLLSLVSACGRSDRGPVAPVEGTVTYRGKPLAAGTIVFEVPKARPANGKIVDGKITEVTTYDPGDGVPVGSARVAVFAQADRAGATKSSSPGQPVTMGANYMDSGKSLIPAKYNNPATSGLSAEIGKGRNTIELKLE